MTALVPACGGEDKPAVDAAPPADVNSSCGGTKAYLDTCATDNECSTCACKPFGHANFCTQACDGNEDCPAPSGGCSVGFCRP